MKKTIIALATTVLLAPTASLAETNVIEGAEAEKVYSAEKSKYNTLAQVDKLFVLRSPNGTEESKPKSLTVKVGEKIFITNEEEKYVHNVYDTTDNSWVLKKQEPGGVAAISFSKPGEHKLRCAIHPKMKIKITVE